MPLTFFQMGEIAARAIDQLLWLDLFFRAVAAAVQTGNERALVAL
ncbi:hypothetical protein [Burkholderia sp. S171]|nr:hypothetical protein [Burkholderia sp. S171]